MFKIGDFSKMSKVTIKALRYYEKEGLIKPIYIENSNGYRYYESNQLLDISRIISLKQVGLSIDEIKRIIIKKESLDNILKLKKEQLKNAISEYNYQLSKIKYLLEEKDMKEKIFEKVIPAYYVYYKEGIIKDYSESSKFIQESGIECLKLNPSIKCVEPDYCFVNYLDGEYKDKNIKIRYCQAVVKDNKPFKENDSIKFMDIPEVKCICIYHKGAYNELGISYGKIMKYIEDNKLEIIDFPRECYIDGIWNKENIEDWLTEIQVPIK
ncbi:MAG: MerR family transcriptional regulator [bacterium]|nr:MerR family transcriptional regulator [bacterium]